MKVNIGAFAHNSKDWERFQSGDSSLPPATPDFECVQRGLALGDLAEPLGFDGIWAPEHQGTPYGMTPNPLQMLTYFAGRTQHVSLGTMVAVAPWWHPVRLAHQIAYLDILSNGRYTTIGLGRGVAKSEFDAVGVPREESRQRFDETLDILNLAFSQERFSYDGKIFKIPEMSLRPAPKSRDLFSRIHGSSATRDSLEILARRGMVPLFVGNKPIEEAGKEVQFVNTIRQEVWTAALPAEERPVHVLHAHDGRGQEGRRVPITANRDVALHYGFADSSNFIGVKGYEAYAAREAAATAVLATAASKGPRQKARNARLSSVESDDRNAGRSHQADYRGPAGLLFFGDHDRLSVWHHAVRRGAEQSTKLFAERFCRSCIKWKRRCTLRHFRPVLSLDLD